MNNISFPEMGINFKINPVAFELPVVGEVRWYGILIGLGILLAFLYCSYVAKKEDVSADTLADIIIYTLPVAIVCARTYYVIFTWDSYKNNLSDVFKIWEGGLAIYGGIFGAVATGLIYCKIKKLETLKIFDICALGLLIGQAVGRWGNFMNAEAFGTFCSGIFGMSINGEAPVHPTFLYESLWNVLGLIILSLLHRKRPFNGFTFFSYVTWYGAGRFIIEGLRADSLYLGGFRISQLVALVCVIAGISVICILSEKNIRKKSGK